MSINVAPFPVDPVLSGIVIAYANDELIADQVLPRVKVAKSLFRCYKYDLADGFTTPDTLIGRKSEPTQVEISATQIVDATQAYGLDDIVPVSDIENAPPGRDPLALAAEHIARLVALAREARTVNLVFNPNTYAQTNKLALSGTSQFSDQTNSDPIGTLMNVLDSCIMRPNVMVVGRSTFSALARHPKIVKAVLGNSGDSGIAKRKDIADLFELDDVLVGSAWQNFANRGQTPDIRKLWGKHMALLRVEKSAGTGEYGPTFGFTAQRGERIAGQIPEPKLGLRGSVRVRAGEEVKEMVCAPDLGFFIQNAIA